MKGGDGGGENYQVLGMAILARSKPTRPAPPRPAPERWRGGYGLYKLPRYPGRGGHGFYLTRPEHIYKIAHQPPSHCHTTPHAAVTPHSDHPSLRSPLTPQACSVIIQSQSPHSKKKYKPRSHRQLLRTAATLPQPWSSQKVAPLRVCWRSIFSCNPHCCTCTVSRQRNPPAILDLPCSHQASRSKSSIFGAGRGNTGRGGLGAGQRKSPRPSGQGGVGYWQLLFGAGSGHPLSGPDPPRCHPYQVLMISLKLFDTFWKKSTHETLFEKKKR